MKARPQRPDLGPYYAVALDRHVSLGRAETAVDEAVALTNGYYDDLRQWRALHARPKSRRSALR